ncbi:SGNH/GDSL hydrolase family protein [Nocardioides caldifontis]|uniref:SGNH/GDSL hydrolase family protein n=1 Tax=Nocardioides caldifontis TaxID=2588938 RepID=UPI0011DFECDF|nr:SGNH/GDSL hydrolase family protein [Nocardioides caldifontis]
MTMTTVPLTSALLRGALDLQTTARGLVPRRLPAWEVAQAGDGQLAMAESQPSGVRLVMATAATTLELDTIPTKREYAGAPRRPDGVYELLVDGEPFGRSTADGGDVVAIDMATGGFEHRPGAPATVRFDGLPAGEKRVELWLPHDETTVLVALRADAPVDPVPADAPVWLHHGSSISHGSNATHPTGTWPAVAARLAGVDLLNLGFGGSALLDPFVARVVRDTPADRISLKLGINVVNQDLMRARAFRTAVHGYLDTIRDGHPTTPLLVVSPVLCPMHEEVPGPSGFDTSALAEGRLSFVATGDPAEVAAGKLTLRVVREVLREVVEQRAADDPALFHLDGRELYGEGDAEALPLPDALHPDGATHRLMGERFARLAFGDGGPLAR